ncbi:MAG: M3 family metallopeptidase [Myxococcota bacterium]
MVSKHALALAFLATACSVSPRVPNVGQAPASAPGVMASAPKIAPSSNGLALDWDAPAALTATCRARLKRIAALREAVKIAPADRVMQIDDTMRRELDRLSGMASLMAAVHPNDATRTAAEKCERDLQTLNSDISLDRAVYDALAAAEKQPLDAMGQRSLQKGLRAFRRAGVDRDAAVRAQLKKLSEEMVRVSQDFSRAIRDDSKSLMVPAADLEGLPADFRQAHPPNAEGQVRLTTDYPDFFPVQRYAKREALRRKLYRLYLERGYPANDENLRTLLRLRREYANALGFKTWADYDAEEKMTKTSERIGQFIAQLQSIVRPRSAADLEVLVARKKKDDPKATKLEVWDRFYYVDRVRAEAYAFDAQSVRPYFSFKRVTQGLMDLYGELFNVRFEADTTTPVWHPSVLAYRLYSQDTLIGKFFLDMHPRAGKYGHAAMFPIQTGLADGQLAIASLVCNFPDPGKRSPALMEHSQVVTYFHEFGHLVHHLLANGSPYVNLGGISTEWDFVEAPSQLLEEWAWDPAVLARFAHHHETKAPIPPELVARMRRSAEFGKGAHVQRQLYYTALSYFLHTADPTSLDLSTFQQKMMKTYSPHPHPADTHGYASFGHLSGYSSAYYTYQWSLVLAKDIFTRFDQEGLLNPNTAADYRKAILMPGGSKDAADLVRAFLGRDSQLDAYRAWLSR